VKSHFDKITKIGDITINRLLKTQCMDENHPEYGGFIVEGKGFSEPAWVIRNACYYIAQYYNEKSKYYKNPLLLDRAKKALLYTVSRQYEDGTIDLLETNFHDATAVAFVIQQAAYAYRVMEKYSEKSSEETFIMDTLYDFFEKSAYGIKNGGFHTPNHRWVMCSALALLINILNRKDLYDEIILYLREGIDCNEYGEYSERSAGTYNEINNRSLIIMAGELHMPGLYEYVKRNLYLMMTYIEPDGTVCTLNSRRQDFGTVVYPSVYYENYLLMAHLTKNKHFAYMADQLLSMHHDEELDRGDLSAFGFPFMALRYMADDFLRENECEKEPFDTEHYHKFYESSNIVRIRDKDRSLTILGGQEAFLKFQKGHNYTILRIAASYFGPKGRFLPKLEKTESGYRLSYECEWGYVRPLGKVKGSLKDGKIDWEFREKVHTMTWTMTVDVSYEDGEVKLQTESSNINRLPFKIDLLFPAEGTLEHDSFSVKGTKGSYMIVKKGSFEYRYQDDRITVEGAFGEHEYTKDKRPFLSCFF
jgi:hypothetical protein